MNVFIILFCQSAPLEAGDDLIRLTFGLDGLRLTNLFSDVSVDRADASVYTVCFAGCQTTCVSQRNLVLKPLSGDESLHLIFGRMGDALRVFFDMWTEL